ncbi:hypothetical protein FGB62_213g04 [Gracilaria domingensis]|nr:hypothetical protein FGB62_213g04 [Gracilaria domingensis]
MSSLSSASSLHGSAYSGGGGEADTEAVPDGDFDQVADGDSEAVGDGNTEAVTDGDTEAALDSLGVGHTVALTPVRLKWTEPQAHSEMKTAVIKPQSAALTRLQTGTDWNSVTEFQTRSETQTASARERERETMTARARAWCPLTNLQRETAL